MSVYGETFELGIARQNSYGTLNTSSLFWLPIIDESVKLDIPPLISQAMRGIHDEGQHYQGPSECTGDITIEAQAIPLGALLRSVCRNHSAVESAATVAFYTHTFLPTQPATQGDFDKFAANDPYTIHKNLQTGSADIMYDLVGSALEFSISNGEFLTAKVTMIGGKYSEETASTASFPLGDRFRWNQFNTITISGTSITELRALTITHNENLEAKHVLGSSAFPGRTKRAGFRTVEVSGTIIFPDKTEYAAFRSLRETGMVINMQNAALVSSGFYEQFGITIPAFRYTDFPINAGGPGEIEVSFSAKGVYHAGSATSIQYTLVNTQATY